MMPLSTSSTSCNHELRGVARRQLSRERSPHALSPTTLVHEAYLRLVRQRQLGAADRSGFLAVAGHTMRRILVDEARRRKRMKRGGDEPVVSLDEQYQSPILDGDVDQLLALDALLEKLAAMNDRAVRVVEYRISRRADAGRDGLGPRHVGQDRPTDVDDGSRLASQGAGK